MEEVADEQYEESEKEEEASEAAVQPEATEAPDIVWLALSPSQRPSASALLQHPRRQRVIFLM